jgi:hypothetical protein
MSDALRLLQDLAQVLRDLRIDPLAAVIVVAILAAYAEQRLARGRAPQFTSEHSDIAADPDNSATRKKRRR